MHPGLGLFPAYYALEEDPKEMRIIDGCMHTCTHVCLHVYL